jgi:Kef-type K+ transport system membrane component KefB
MMFFLFVAGLEVDLSDFRRLGRQGTSIGLVGTIIPIIAGVGLAYLMPSRFWGPGVQGHFFAFALFLGLNLANSANPVIARILMDLGLLKEHIGTVVMTATIFDDLINWTLFAIILRQVSPADASATSLSLSFGMILVFIAFVLIVGRRLGPRALHFARMRLPWPSGFIALTILLIMVAGSISEVLGMHAFLGAFLVGIALGGHNGETNEAHDVISHFSLSFFAPIYFVSMGLTVNFAANFDLAQVLVVLVAACVSKIGGVILGARLAGMPLTREVWAIAFGLNARGATGIILAGVGLAYGVIDERIFVTVVIMAIATSLMSAPMIKALIAQKTPQPLSAVRPAEESRS